MEKRLQDRLQALEPAVWINNSRQDSRPGSAETELASGEKVSQAIANWSAMAPLLVKCFPELEASAGRVRSALIEVPDLWKALGHRNRGRGFIKGDHALPVAGSVKARGGIYEVFMHGRALAQELGLVSAADDWIRLATKEIRDVFGNYTVAVGSTGNLGLSVGMAARGLGFRAVVHMSSDAKPWKVERLRRHGVEVVQHQADYGTAVASAREQADNDETIYFVDDERSELLFYGYSAAALELKEQLNQGGIAVDAEHPLFLYLPCGIGGAPGGVTFGARNLFGNHVHCFFVEPVQSPCALVQMASGLDRVRDVYELGLTNRTEADGMAVAEMSQFVAGVMEPILSGVYTVADDDLFRWLALARDCENLQLEPSAASAIGGPAAIAGTQEGQAYLREQGISSETLTNATHVMWATGGQLVPDEEYQLFLKRGRDLLGSS
ncbi:D-serine ammonia-lyase [Kiloniella sp. b19]|uniref:D-serine ammonia-lyase n=1 Tax=Kiloniella sp. GXU_MW_B19 TaxID=3141326 RepID=UPI0031D18D23